MHTFGVPVTTGTVVVFHDPHGLSPQTQVNIILRALHVDQQLSRPGATLDTTRILLNSKSSAHPNGLGNSSGMLGCYLSEHIMGIRGSGYIPARIGTETTLDDGRAVSPYIPRFRNVTDRHPDFIRGYHFQGGGGAGEFPGNAYETPGFGKGFKSSVRKHYPALLSLGGFGEVLPRKENRVSIDPAGSLPPVKTPAIASAMTNAPRKTTTGRTIRVATQPAPRRSEAPSAM